MTSMCARLTSLDIRLLTPHPVLAQLQAGLNVYQTYFLDAKNRDLWTDKQVRPGSTELV